MKFNEDRQGVVDVSIIIPTFNEKDNIEILLERINTHVKNFKYEVIFVDDDSPDKTALKVQELSIKYPAMCIVRKNEKGLATAVVEGFKHAKGEIFVVMDADLQHPPEKIKYLIEEIEKGSDIAIGSRYVEKNGEGFGEFSSTRKIISKSANILAKTLFSKLLKVNDIQSGFFALKKNVVENIDLKPKGYKILLEILAIGNYKTVKEVPFIFEKRKKGQSKLKTGVIFEYLFHLASLFWRENETKRITKFMLTGLAGIVVSVGLLWFLTEIVEIFYVTSGIISKEAGTLFSFGLSEIWVFNDRIKVSLMGSLKRCFQFNLNRLVTVTMVILVMAILTEFFGVYYIISNFVGILLAFPVNYVLSNKYIWKNKASDEYVL